MKTAEASILFVPGWSNSSPEHWQSRWQSKLPTGSRVEQEDWMRPVLHRWVDRIVAAVQEAPNPVVLIGHSCGVPTIVHAATALPSGKVRGAYLVAPLSESGVREMEGTIDPAYAPFPRDPLPFPSLLVASRNDPYCAYDDAGDYANAWGSALVDAGEAGHINAASGHGPWPEGLLRFAGFLRQL